MFFEPLGLENKTKFLKRVLTFLQFRAHFQKKTLETAEMLKTNYFLTFLQFRAHFPKKTLETAEMLKVLIPDFLCYKKNGFETAEMFKMLIMLNVF